jgi:hypothetical protein
MRPIHDPGQLAIGSDLVVAAAVVRDFEDFVSEVFRLTLARTRNPRRFGAASRVVC